MDLCSDLSMDFSQEMSSLHASINTYSVTASGGFFQIRPQKDFKPERGRNHALSLGLLSDLPEDTIDRPDLDASAEPRNAYEFMQRRRSAEGNPTLKRWNASVRMSNFATLDVSPFAVRGSHGTFPFWQSLSELPFLSWVRLPRCSTILLENKRLVNWNLRASAG